MANASPSCDTGLMFWCEVARDSVAVSGRDAASFLQSQVSQDLRTLGDGDSAWTFLLDPSGKVEVLARVVRRDEATFFIDTDAGYGEVLVARLQRFRIRVQADISSVDRSIVAVRGADDLGPTPSSLVAWGGGVDLDVTGAVDGGRSLVAAVVGSDHVRRGDAADLLTARVAACWPAMGAEIVPGSTLPAETGLIDRAVSFGKGCYPGQELVERMDSRGASAPFRLMSVEVAAGAAPGDDLVIDGEVVGRLTSVAGHRAIARVRRA